MYPLVGEVNLHTVNIVHLCCSVGSKHFLHLHQYGINIRFRSQVDTVLGYLIVGECLAQLTDLTTFLRKRSQEEGDTHQCVTSVVALGINHSTVALATDNGIHLLHLRGDIHLTHSGSTILSTVFLGHITQGTSRRKIRNGIAGSLRQHIVCHTHQCIFLAKHLSVFTDKGQTVHIGIHHDTQVVFAGLHLVHNALQVFLQRLRVVGKVAIGFTVQDSIFHTQLL